MTEEKKIEEMEKEIAELEKKKAEMLSPPPEIPKEEEKEPEIVGIVPDTPENQKIMEDVIESKYKDYTPPDPTDVIINPSPKPKKTEFEGGIYITWIDNRYHINGVRGIPNGNRIIVRSLKAVDSLIRHLQYARDKFSQDTKMINTKAPK